MMKIKAESGKAKSGNRREIVESLFEKTERGGVVLDQPRAENLAVFAFPLSAFRF